MYLISCTFIAAFSYSGKTVSILYQLVGVPEPIG